MKNSVVFLVMSIVACAGVCAGPPPGYDLVWSDEFNGTTADLDKNWDFQNGPSGHILCSRWRENVAVENGLCRLLNKKETRGGQGWTSGSMWTTRQFRYGYFECRYRYGAATGLNNSFWIMNRLPAGAPGRFELDINEGHWPDSVNMNIHNWSGQHGSRSKSWRAEGSNLAKEFHVYGFEWSEKELVWSFDGKEIRREANTLCHGPAPVWLSSAIIKWAGEVTDTIDGTSMDADYVRVYQRRDTKPASDEVDFNTMLRPVPASAKFADPDFYIWCGTMVKGDDGKCHLFYSRWPRKLGHNAWVTHSEIAHAVGNTPLGPFQHKDVALPARGKEFWDGLCTHNPNVHKFGRKYYLYYMGNTGDGVNMKTLNWTHRNNQRVGVAVADSPDGPWKRFDQPLIAPTPGFLDALCCTNPTVTERPGGGYLMIYKAVADKNKPPFGGPVLHVVATSDSPTGPFKNHPAPVFAREGVAFPAEDPFLWSADNRYWAIVKDNNGYFTGTGKSTALWESDDGFDWKLARHPLVATTDITWADGGKQKLNSLERPQLYFENGRPVVLMFACDEDNKREHSFNVRIPLEPAR
jgi:Glycosyl hydrolases family 16